MFYNPPLPSDVWLKVPHKAVPSLYCCSFWLKQAAAYGPGRGFVTVFWVAAGWILILPWQTLHSLRAQSHMIIPVWIISVFQYHCGNKQKSTKNNNNNEWQKYLQFLSSLCPCYLVINSKELAFRRGRELDCNRKGSITVSGDC